MVEKSQRLPEIGRAVRFWRKTVRGMTLHQLGEFADSNATNLAKLERGEAGLSLARFEKVAEGLNVPLAALIDPTTSYARLKGTLSGPGVWVKNSPLIDSERAIPVVQPVLRDAHAAEFAFADGDDMLFCGPSNETPVHGQRYVVLRGDFIEGTLHYELAVRRFERDASAALFEERASQWSNDLERAVTLGVPSRITREKGAAAAFAEAARRVLAAGCFELDRDETADPRSYHQKVARDDGSISQHWLLIAEFRFLNQ